MNEIPLTRHEIRLTPYEIFALSGKYEMKSVSLIAEGYITHR